MHLVMTEFDCLDVAQCGWQDDKIQLLTNFKNRVMTNKQTNCSC